MACKNCDCADCKKGKPKGKPDAFKEYQRPQSRPKGGKVAAMIGYSDAPLPDSK